MFDDRTIARKFKALAHPRRARIFRLLVDRPELGLGLDPLGTAARIPPASLMHHLRAMERCGLITRRRKGNHILHSISTAQFAQALAAKMRLSTKRPRRRAA